MSLHEVRKCLSRANSKYADSAKTDVMAALQQFKDLRPDTENFMFPDGKRRMSFALKGTIPVNYKGNTYSIPIGVYLYDTHPYYAPVCYVKPTKSMVVKESEHVNKEGRLFLPYLTEWRFPGYDLSGLLQMMTMIFQEKCPVFAASSRSSQPPQPQPQPKTPQQTPYPTSQPAYPVPFSNSGPPYPNAGTSGYNPYMNVPNSTPYPIAMPNAMPTPGGYHKAPQPPPRPPGPTNTMNTGTLQEETIRMSVISALEDRLRNVLREKLGTNWAEMESIQATGDDLRAGQQKLKKGLEEADTQRAVLLAAESTYRTKKEELSKAVEACGGGEELPIDEAIDAATPLHKQILANYAKDLSCEDVIYGLGQALKRRELSLSDYLRRVRDVSREQFIHRATMQKARRTAGLPL